MNYAYLHQNAAGSGQQRVQPHHPTQATMQFVQGRQTADIEQQQDEQFVPADPEPEEQPQEQQQDEQFVPADPEPEEQPQEQQQDEEAEEQEQEQEQD